MDRASDLCGDEGRSDDWPDDDAPASEFLEATRRLSAQSKAPEAHHMARLAGRAACREGVALHDCPFDEARDPGLAKRWRFGWTVYAGAKCERAKAGLRDPFDFHGASPYGGDDAA